MNKIILAIIGTVTIFGIVFISVLMNSSIESKKNNLSVNTEVKTIKADKVQIFLFHTTQRCTTCIAIGKLAGETTNDYFQPELRDGKIEFREINIDLPENKALAEKFQAGGSALFINAIYNGQDHIDEDVQVWRLTQNSVQFKSYLKNKIDNLLGK